MKIKVYTSYNETNKSHFSREFEVIDALPTIGEIEENRFDGERFTVKEIQSVAIDCEQGRDEVFDYDYFKIVKTLERLEDDEWELYDEDVEYVAVEKEMTDDEN